MNVFLDIKKNQHMIPANGVPSNTQAILKNNGKLQKLFDFITFYTINNIFELQVLGSEPKNPSTKIYQTSTWSYSFFCPVTAREC